MNYPVGTSWQNPEVAHRFLEERRGAIPYGPDQMEIMLHLVERLAPDPEQILDLGCGGGIGAHLLLDRFPGCRAILIDHSEPMLQQARNNLCNYGERTFIVQADMTQPLEPRIQPSSLDVVISSYAIHHLPHERKRTLYEEIFAALRPGGLFVNVEHVASPTPEIEALFDELYLDSMARNTRRSRSEIATEYHSRADKKDNILAPVELQIEWLREIGFEQVDCFFKWMELAVFGGLKTALG